MSVCLNLALVLGVVIIVLNSDSLIVRAINFWLCNREEEWEYEEEKEKVLPAMLGVVAVDIMFSLCYIFILSLFVKFPNPAGEDYLQKYGALHYLGILFVAGLAEEAVFRWIPLSFGYMVKGIFKRDWYRNLGIISALLFGMMHMTNYASPDPSYLLLVVPQMVGGLLLYWFALKYKHGWVFVVYAHFIFNVVVSLSSILGLK